MSDKPELYIVFDIEADGPCPGVHSMLSLGCVAVSPAETSADENELGNIVDQFYCKLDRLPGAQRDSDTTIWWNKHPRAYQEATRDPEAPILAMNRFKAWLEGMSQNFTLVAVAFPAGFDWPFLYYYMHRFLGESPLGFTCLDMKTMAMPLINSDYTMTRESKMPKEWFADTLKHDHIAINDAKYQAYTFLMMLKESQAMAKTHQVEQAIKREDAKRKKKKTGIVDLSDAKRA